MTIHIRRREFIITLGSIAVARPLAARAQETTVPVIGFFSAGSAQPLKGISLPICLCNNRRKAEMYLNLKTARALGITIPLPLSGRPDEIFE